MKRNNSVLGFYDIDQTIREESDLTNLIVERYRERKPLKKVTALLFQHQLTNHVPQTKALIDLGLDPRKIYWVDIPYTSHKPIRKAVQAFGIPKRNFVTCSDYRLLDMYAPYQRGRAIRIYEKLKKKDIDRLIVLDDGAYFLEAASCFGRQIQPLAIVEQTSRGFKKLANNSAMQKTADALPLIDVARSVPKRKLESPFIGAAVCVSLARHITETNMLVKPVHKARCLILGYGDIGSSVSAFLLKSGGFSQKNIFVCDPRFKEGKLSTEFQTWERANGGSFDLVIGCSGTTSFDVGDYVFLNDGAVLVSASSGAVEFNRRNIVEWAAVSKSDDIRIDRGAINMKDLHSPISIHFPGRSVRLLNGGWPMNFDGRLSCIPGEFIQITTALMVQAAVQAAEAEHPGIYSIDPEVAEWLTSEFYSLVGDMTDWLPRKSDVIREIRKQNNV